MNINRDFIRNLFLVRERIPHVIPCDAMGSGMLTGNGSLVCGSHAPANKPWRWLEIYLGKKKHTFMVLINIISLLALHCTTCFYHEC